MTRVNLPARVAAGLRWFRDRAPHYGLLSTMTGVCVYLVVTAIHNTVVGTAAAILLELPLLVAGFKASARHRDRTCLRCRELRPWDAGRLARLPLVRRRLALALGHLSTVYALPAFATAGVVGHVAGQNGWAWPTYAMTPLAVAGVLMMAVGTMRHRRRQEWCMLCGRRERRMYQKAFIRGRRSTPAV